jgi:hypothetical protein
LRAPRPPAGIGKPNSSGAGVLIEELKAQVGVCRKAIISVSANDPLRTLRSGIQLMPRRIRIYRATR